MSTTDTKAPAVKKPKLTTSSMIASIAAEGQATKSAPFGLSGPTFLQTYSLWVI
jgi:hypothetical protein